MSPRIILGLGILLLVQSSSCGSSSVVGPSGTRVRVGTWGGEHAGLTVTDSGARAEFDCANGEINQPLTLDVGGRFAVDGVFVQESPGPVPDSGDSARKPARYSGRIDDNTMTLNVVLIESKQEIGSFRLTYGATPLLRKCL